MSSLSDSLKDTRVTHKKALEGDGLLLFYIFSSFFFCSDHTRSAKSTNLVAPFALVLSPSGYTPAASKSLSNDPFTCDEQLDPELTSLVQREVEKSGGKIEKASGGEEKKNCN